MPQHLLHRSPVDPEMQRRLACAHAVAMTGQPNLAIKLHRIHLPALSPMSSNPRRETGALLRRHRGQSTAFSWCSIAPAFSAELEMRSDSPQHYCEIRFNMIKDRALELLFDHIPKTADYSPEILVHGTANKRFGRWKQPHSTDASAA